MVYGFDIPVDYCLNTEIISKKKLKKMIKSEKEPEMLIREEESKS